MLFTNGPQLFDNTYQRYLVRQFRDRLPFPDVPIRLYLRDKAREGPAGVNEDTDPNHEALAAAAAAKKLKFKTEVTDEDFRDDGDKFESGIWRDV